ncbi:hypothetical protein [Corynebacterium efficiens YS-314]|uniref:Uncharacterized protein n=1 Tax=Corynebacterium efficiens (strain DSM 44549 / YS-314 / AJ 12310 / JCM 11189 / NBRC 100395) TaxID=196164 RepID=Q8FNX7_COREF|nr:hypothetical protein [Corynebacterium efficiens YS-314]
MLAGLSQNPSLLNLTRSRHARWWSRGWMVAAMGSVWVTGCTGVVAVASIYPPGCPRAFNPCVNVCVRV